MSAEIPNFGPPGNDTCRDPQLVSVPVVIYNNGNMNFWYPEALDYSSANRLVWSLIESGDYARRIDLPMILPPPDWILEETDNLDLLRCEPFRLKLLVDSE